MDQRRHGSDFLQLGSTAVEARSAGQGIADWLVEEVRRALGEGRLARGDRLPATRVLAADLGVSRGVVVEAYQRLHDEGLLRSRTRAGTVVADTPSPAIAAVPTVATTSRLPRPAVAAAEGIDLDLTPGVPDLAAFPRATWLRQERAVLREMSAADLGYGDPQGHPALRRELAGWLGRTRGVVVEPDGVVVVSGVAQALALLAQTLVSRGEHVVAVEDPGSRGAREELQHWGMRPVPVPVDDDGLVVGALAATDATSAVLTPAHQFPTGVVLAPDRRRELLAWCADDRLVVEDDYDAEHRYDRAPVAALQRSAPDRVAHTGSTSKTLAPAMRLGWLVPPRSMLADLVTAKHASDLGSPGVPQLVLARLLATGEYDVHLRRVRVRQRHRRDAVVAALAEHVPHARVDGVAAGLHLVVSLPGLAPGDDVDLAARAAERGVRVHPLSWHRTASGPSGLVLGYAAHPPDRLRDAVARLAEVL